MPYNDDGEHVSAAPQKSPSQPILEFVERLRPSDRNLRVAAQASQRGAALRAKMRLKSQHGRDLLNSGHDPKRRDLSRPQPHASHP